MRIFGSITNTYKNYTIIGETIEETLLNIHFTYVDRHDNFSLVLFRMVVEKTNL